MNSFLICEVGAGHPSPWRCHENSHVLCPADCRRFTSVISLPFFIRDAPPPLPFIKEEADSGGWTSRRRGREDGVGEGCSLIPFPGPHHLRETHTWRESGFRAGDTLSGSWQDGQPGKGSKPPLFRGPSSQGLHVSALDSLRILMGGGDSGASGRAAGPQWERGGMFFCGPSCLLEGGEKKSHVCEQRTSPVISVNQGC